MRPIEARICRVCGHVSRGTTLGYPSPHRGVSEGGATQKLCRGVGQPGASQRMPAKAALDLGPLVQTRSVWDDMPPLLHAVCA